MKMYRERSGRSPGTGCFYRELQRLMVDGLVRAATPSSQADPRRTPYVITERGVAVFDAWFTDGATSDADGGPEDQLSVRSLLLSEVDGEVVRKVLDRWQDALWLRVKQLEFSRDAAAERHAGDPQRFPIRSLLIARRTRRVTSDVVFLNELRTAYERWLESREQGSDPGPSKRADQQVVPRTRRATRGRAQRT